MRNINHIKAYIAGLLVGGGKVDRNTFIVDLPFKKWGMDPSRMNVIATDILTKICSYFNQTYNFNVTYEIGNSKWLIRPVSNVDISELILDLEYLGLPTHGFLLAGADLSTAKQKLSGICIEKFLSGIFDARASLTLSHRRFSDDAPTVSIEVPGSTKNFKFVVQLCSWLTDLGSITDQILYNHPNQHSASDPEYKGWKKGFKIRFLVKSFLARNSFALQSKSIDIAKIEKSQSRVEQIPCYLRKLKTPSAVTIHTDQNSLELPAEVKNKIFFHYLHFCSLLGCPHAPMEEIRKMVNGSAKLISFFPRLSKGMEDGMMAKFNNIRSLHFPDKEIFSQQIQINSLMTDNELANFSGLRQGIAYLIADELKGKRHSGTMQGIIDKNLAEHLIVFSIGRGFDSPLLVVNGANGRAFICSSVSNKLNQTLIARQIKISDISVSIR
ncbi:MAG: hypothetical protein V4649_08560 [Bacteroidota bacterium]